MSSCQSFASVVTSSWSELSINNADRRGSYVLLYYILCIHTFIIFKEGEVLNKSKKKQKRKIVPLDHVHFFLGNIKNIFPVSRLMVPNIYYY